MEKFIEVEMVLCDEINKPEVKIEVFKVDSNNSKELEEAANKITRILVNTKDSLMQYGLDLSENPRLYLTTVDEGGYYTVTVKGDCFFLLALDDQFREEQNLFRRFR